MACQVTVVAGPASSGKTTRLLCAYRQSLVRDPVGSALWLSPTHRAAEGISRQLLDDSLIGCLNPNLLTFEQLSTRVLAASPRRRRPISRAMVRMTLARLIDDALDSRRLRYFAPIAHTSGFLDLLVAFVREFKRLEIWPEELAAVQGPRASQKDKELCALYQAYQDQLNDHDLYDAQGQFWAARRLLREGHWGPLAAVRHIYVDGFSDFTRTEYEVLELLAARAKSLEISLIQDPDGQRSDLFTKTELTLQHLRERHPQLVVDQLPVLASGPAGLVHLHRRLFGNPRLQSPAEDASGIEIVAAAGVTHEIELIAGRIKGLLADGDAAGPVAPEDVLVVFRSVGELAPLIREVFNHYGVPHGVATAPTLESNPAIAALLGWLRLDAEDWPFRQLLTVLAHNYFRPLWPSWQDGRAVLSVESLVRELELPSGRGELLDSVERLESRAAAVLAAKQQAPPHLLAARAAGPLLRNISQALDSLPRQATAGQWIKSLDSLAVELGIRQTKQGKSESPPPQTQLESQDDLAWQRLGGCLAEIDRFARWTGQSAPVFDRGAILQVLQDLVRNEQQPLAGDETGVVRVLAAESARGLAAPYVFLAGLSERAFPPANRDDCLYTDADARRWGAQGLPLPSHELRGRFEMLLFYEMVTRATRHLVLSYPGLDGSAQPLVPSPYLSEVEQACGPGKILRNSRPHLDCVPASDQVRCVRDFRVRAVSQVLHGEDGLISKLWAHPSTHAVAVNILAGLQMSETRFKGEGYGPFEGILGSPAAAARLAQRYGPDRCWSPSQLEQYAYCPHQFFLKNVLRAAPLNEPELGVDYLQRGQMLHWLLSTAHRELNQLSSGPHSPGQADRAQFAELVERLAQDLRDRGPRGALESGLLEIDVRKIMEWLQRYGQQHAEYDQQWAQWDQPPRPAHFEVAFGPRHRRAESDAEGGLPEDCDSLSNLEPFELDCEDETIKFAGRIDRIDLGKYDGQTVFTIVDYKSGAASKRTTLQAVLDGQSLQLPIYALAARRLLSEQNAAPFRAAYWQIAGKGYQEKEAVKFQLAEDGRLERSQQWDDLEAALATRVRSLVEGIRQGQFPMHSADDHCTGFCSYSTVCRVNQTRSLEKQWQPPVAPGNMNGGQES